MLWMILAMLLAFWAMSHFANKQQKKLQAQQQARTDDALAVPGTWVRTRAGFYGTVVEVDGDVVTLATPLGDESLWAKSAIVGAEEPPFASLHEEEDDEDVTEDTAPEALTGEPQPAVEEATGSDEQAGRA
ncbi:MULTISPECIES: preprotein translocase subunit YajC [unclassified Actinomyces]|uniref:preprotein translocase subunit YajC n=1 Tax=unclassified Actinomyces TaxID=2609248 RepID=UPI002016D6F6|nr:MULTISPECIES: preprotein translocase subunit YajC [unclassified Actinomyces]MCL3778346.1 preprotein translocase subunit YajC [Actinomyces sp. AC-20-1]MCL3790207.1 preprotein translocase subunit YajC [Actinomyces sp. 187325]MCL3792482.1 preprotein translocase subunit YajC [Actinomyces sp. 186855]MCL3794318.1 preprotein translocase subunit YajC [Actinomyces sp. 217892]